MVSGRLIYSKRILLAGIFFMMLVSLSAAPEIHAQSTGTGSGTLPNISINVDNGEGAEDFSLAIQALILVTVLSFGPAIITMMTSFTRLIVVFFFLRMGLGTQQSPPNQVLIGLSIFITIFIMAPTFDQITEQAIDPYTENAITQQQALTAAAVPLKEFMIKQTREEDLLLFMDMGGYQAVNSVEEMPLYVVVPAYMISELRIAFQIGFLIYLPFMVIDLVVASVLLSMGIMFLPPVLVSLPFKILIFVLTDGWYLLVESLVKSFN